MYNRQNLFTDPRRNTIGNKISNQKSKVNSLSENYTSQMEEDFITEEITIEEHEIKVEEESEVEVEAVDSEEEPCGINYGKCCFIFKIFLSLQTLKK